MTELSTTDRSEAPAIEVKILATGSNLLTTLARVVDAVPEAPQGPQALAKRINVDKVLASRLLRAVRSADEMSALHRFPGPAPLRRVLKGVAKLGVDAALIDDAARAVDQFEGLIRNDLGDRGALDAIVAAWVPEARRDFELRSKQSAYKAMSQIKGVRADATLATAIVAPSDDGEHLDLVWVTGLIGVHRLRPGAGVKVATRRIHEPSTGRHPRALDGRPLAGLHDAVLPEFSTSPPPVVDVHRNGEVVQYTLGCDSFGPDASQDIVLVEVNRSELRRFAVDGENRRRFVFAEASLPTNVIQFDALVHADVFPGSTPSLAIYDTSMEGVADVNDPSRDLDRLDMLESIEQLGNGVERIGSAVVPRYGKLIRHVLDAMSWDAPAFRAHRCRIEYPVYGSQIVMSFKPPPRE